ncbi:hypothetical protein ACJX0J_027893, partial [Zea mays]
TLLLLNPVYLSEGHVLKYQANSSIGSSATSLTINLSVNMHNVKHDECNNPYTFSERGTDLMIVICTTICILPNECISISFQIQVGIPIFHMGNQLTNSKSQIYTGTTLFILSRETLLKTREIFKNLIFLVNIPKASENCELGTQ